MLIDRLIGV